MSKLTRTKIIPPPHQKGLLSRLRLIELLHELLDHKLILISAPAGYGKTSLLIDMIQHVDLPVCWYALDSHDKDPQLFLSYFIAAIAHRFPNFGKQSTAVLQNSKPNPDWDQITTTIVNDIYEHIQEHFIVVLDDFHFTEQSEEIHTFVNRFVQRVDESCHLIISSRQLTTLSDMPLLVARSQVGGLGHESLAFQAPEIQALLQQNYNLRMPDTEAIDLAQETEGWITGLLLSTQTMARQMADRVRTARVSGVGLYDYLAQQILDQQPAPMRAFLLHTSLLGEFNAELCTAVLEPAPYLEGATWQKLTDEALQNNLFLLPVGDDEKWVRYHHLFQEFLQAQMTQAHPDEVEEIWRRLAAVYTERQNWEQAHQLYAQLDDVARTAILIEQAGLSLIRNARHAMLAGWIEALPGEILTSHPRLLSLHGLALVESGKIEPGLARLNQAETACRAANDDICLAHTLVRRATAHRILGDYQASLSDAEAALARAGESQPIQAAALRAQGLALRRQGELRQAIGRLKEAQRINERLGEASHVALLHIDLGMTYRALGAYEEAETAYKHSLAYWEKLGDITRQASVLNNLGVLYHFTGKYEQAGICLEESLDRARRSGFTRMRALALTSMGDLYVDLEALDEALNAYSRARKIGRKIHDGFLQFYIDIAEAILARLQRDLPQTHARLQSAQKRAQAGGSAYEQGLFCLERGRLALAEKRPAEAITHFQACTQFFSAGDQRLEAARAHLYLATAYCVQGDQETAVSTLAHAFRLASDLENKHFWVVAGREADALLAAAQQEPTIGYQVSQLQSQIAKFEETIPDLRRRLRRHVETVPFAPPQLNIQALGAARVQLDGNLVPHSDWETQVARDLLFLLLAHPKGLTKEAIGALFWPDASPAKLKLNFKKSIYRLRRALNQDAVIFDVRENLYRFNWASDYTYDVEAFRQKLSQAQKETETAAQITAYREALALYTGPYLPQIEGTWAWPERENLQRAYQEAALTLGELYLGNEETCPKTLDICQRLLDEDPCLEEAHRLMMQAYAIMGNWTAVARQFKRCQEALQAELDIPPSPQTQELHQKLMQQWL